MYGVFGLVDLGMELDFCGPNITWLPNFLLSIPLSQNIIEELEGNYPKFFCPLNYNS